MDNCQLKDESGKWKVFVGRRGAAPYDVKRKRAILPVGADIIRPIYFNPSALPTPFLFSLLYYFRIRETVGE